ncbi:phosphoribomutase PRM15 RNJ42_03279 [Nakaseomyces bracarensis]|uniref:phosphoribomutase PRM15 n=1 Tax=Nakaseomyces bracarensis TaxID=273131 RepID=UPI003871FD40
MSINLKSLPSNLRGPIEQWLEWDKNPETLQELSLLCKEEKWDDLHSRFDNRVVFGTAGLRARMEVGTNRLNALVILQASQGLATYIKKQFPNNLSVVIGHDHRYHSQEFAEVTAATFVRAGFKVYYLNPGNEFVHTPMVPFSVDHLKASAGIMITASHNPKMDNGYKVYYANGCQIIPPHDHNIADEISKNLKPWSDEWDFKRILDNANSAQKLRYVKNDMQDLYAKKAKEFLVEDRFEPPSKKPWFVYTPMHGVGYEIFNKILSENLDLKDGIDYITVPEQKNPDPSFKTVSFPNPEEKGALDLGIALAQENDINLVLANDPDADRFSVAVKDFNNGKWRQLTGNEIGLLFAYYELQKYQKLTKSGVEKRPLAMLNSTVSAQLIKKMAEKEGFTHKDTLTGFKWIGNEALKFEDDGFYVPFGYEEAIGYMFPAMEHDKDGVSATIVFLQAYSYWIKHQSLYPIDVIEECYKKYGVSQEYNGYYIVANPDMTTQVFNDIRKLYTSKNLHYPKTVGPNFEVTYFRDLTVGYQSNTPDNIPDLPIDKNSQMISAVVKPLHTTSKDDEVRFTIRGSGTEPKLKVYIEGTSSSEEKAHELAYNLWVALKEEWFKPDVTGLATKF